MSNEQIVSAIAELLGQVAAPLLKELVDIVESKDPDPIGQFEIRRAAYYQALQARLDERFGGNQ